MNSKSERLGAEQVIVTASPCLSSPAGSMVISTSSAPSDTPIVKYKRKDAGGHSRSGSVVNRFYNYITSFADTLLKACAALKEN